MLKFFSKNKKQKVHFLHIGKTGGSAIKAALTTHLESPKFTIKLHGHKKSLSDIPRGESVFFFLRNPVSRFISGFYSRQRKGKPRYYSEWTSAEKNVFETFSTPNQLGISLADKNSKEHLVAISAMENVQHFKPYKKWYGNFEYFQSRIDDILFIGFQESLEADFTKLKRVLQIPESISLPTDTIRAHKNPTNLDKSINEIADLALKNWYSDDFEFISLCNKILPDIRKAHDPNTYSGLDRH